MTRVYLGRKIVSLKKIQWSARVTDQRGYIVVLNLKFLSLMSTYIFASFLIFGILFGSSEHREDISNVRIVHFVREKNEDKRKRYWSHISEARNRIFRTTSVNREVKKNEPSYCDRWCKKFYEYGFSLFLFWKTKVSASIGISRFNKYRFDLFQTKTTM